MSGSIGFCYSKMLFLVASEGCMKLKTYIVLLLYSVGEGSANNNNEQITHGQQRSKQAIGFFYDMATKMFLA